MYILVLIERRTPMPYNVISISKEIRSRIQNQKLKKPLIDESESSHTFTSKFLNVPHVSNLNDLKINPDKFQCIRGAKQIFK